VALKMNRGERDEHERSYYCRGRRDRRGSTFGE